jgi:GT2 family glycosyltransferase
MTNHQSENRPSASPHVGIIIPIWNGLDDTLECLNSLKDLTYPHFSTIVVDNGSTDDSVDAIVAWSKSNLNVIVLQNKTNMGFTGGCNLGIQHALSQQTDYILLLNNDTTITPDFLSILIDVSEQDEGIGMAGPKIYRYGTEGILDSAGIRAIIWLAQPFLQGHGETDMGQYDTQEDCPYITGCALLVKRQVIEQIGMLDEDYINYLEDFDWGYRAALTGYRLVYVPQSHIYHKGSKTSGIWSPFYYYHNTRSRILFARKHISLLLFLFAFLPYLLSYRFLLPALRLIRHRQWNHLRALHTGIKEGFTTKITSKTR